VDECDDDDVCPRSTVDGMATASSLGFDAEIGRVSRRPRKGRKQQEIRGEAYSRQIYMGLAAANSEYVKRYREVERLHSLISFANAAFDDAVDNTKKTRSHKVKRGAKSLSPKIKKLVRNLKKRIAEHRHLVLERNELEDLLKHT